ncbi:response regulator [bacterium]|nr:response regulator [bacterium]
MTKKILIVDDERGIVRLLSMRLKAKGYEVFEAYDGLECVQMAIKEVPDLILLDVKMPQGGGIGAFEKLILSEITREIPVIFMTAYSKLEIKNKVLKMGAMGFVSKPFSSVDFEKIIEMTIAEKG